MRSHLATALAALLAAPGLSAQEPAARAAADPPSAAQQLAALKKEFDDARQACFTAMREAGEDEAKQQEIYETMYPDGAEYASRFQALADAHPGTEEAFDALIWVLGGVREAASQAEVLDQIARDFATHERLDEVCSRLAYSDAANAEAFLEDVLAKSPHRNAQGIACYTLARRTSGHAEAARMIAGDDAKRQQLIEYRGAEFVAQLGDPDALESRAKKRFERVAEEFRDVSYRGRTLGQFADADLFELANLSVGKLAPEISGEDIDGVAFKLSDYRGKVVFLDFWGDW